MPDPSGDIATYLEEIGQGDPGAVEKLVPLVYDELRRIAAAHLRRERPDHTLQPTALVNELYLKLLGQREMALHDRAHFLSVAARLMRQILVDHARAHRAEKRAGRLTRVTLDDRRVPSPERDVDLLALDDALGRLAEKDPQLARLVELRFFGGLTNPETAAVLGVSRATVEREWDTAKAWLLRQMTKDAGR